MSSEEMAVNWESEKTTKKVAYLDFRQGEREKGPSVSKERGKLNGSLMTPNLYCHTSLLLWLFLPVSYANNHEILKDRMGRSNGSRIQKSHPSHVPRFPPPAGKKTIIFLLPTPSPIAHQSPKDRNHNHHRNCPKPKCFHVCPP